MSSEDITFCGYAKCPNKNCERNQSNIKQYWLDHSFALFTECEFWNDDLRRTHEN